MNNLTHILIIVILISCGEKSKHEFSLTGKVKGIDNGVVLYLEDPLNEEIIDSTTINSHSFNFTTKLAETPLRVILRTKDYSHYRYLWLENNPMLFDATETDFLYAKVDGSQTETLSQSLLQQVDTLTRKENLRLSMEFIKKNPNSIVSASILSVYSKSWGKQITKDLFEQFSIENKDSEYGKRIARYIELNKTPIVGEQFVEFEMGNQNGEIKKLSSLKGKIVLLEFWASWCVPCRKENPNLVKTYKKFNPLGFEIFAVSLDKDKQSWLKAIKEDKLIWEHVSDLKGQENEAKLIYGVNGIPANFLIDRTGVIIDRNLRGEELNQKLVEIMPVANRVARPEPNGSG